MPYETPGESALPRSEERIRVIVEMETARIPRQDVDFAIEFLQSLRTPGFEVDAEYRPVTLSREHGMFRGRAVGPTVILRGTVGEKDDIEKLRRLREILEVWLDPPLIEFQDPYACHKDQNQSDYSIEQVMTYLGVDQIWAAGFEGKNTVVGVVDSGIDKLFPVIDNVFNARFPVTDGWPANSWGVGSDHGHMVATDITKLAPRVNLFDLNVKAGDFGVWLSNAIAAYQWAIEKHDEKGVPHILTNSWGAPLSTSAPDYSDDTDHPFTQKVVNAIDEGLVVLFAAGNCGYPCANKFMCDEETRPGKGRIWGANGHTNVMTVGAANISGQYFGDSSQGPAALADMKPDFCAPSYFSGGHFPVDGKTSAATAVLAGLVALLKEAHPLASHADIKNALIETTAVIHRPGFNHQSGYGVVQGYAAHEALSR